MVARPAKRDWVCSAFVLQILIKRPEPWEPGNGHANRGLTLRVVLNRGAPQIAFIENRKIARWREYMDSLAAWTALTAGR